MGFIFVNNLEQKRQKFREGIGVKAIRCWNNLECNDVFRPSEYKQGIQIFSSISFDRALHSTQQRPKCRSRAFIVGELSIYRVI
jgi:hypothetical protein